MAFQGFSSFVLSELHLFLFLSVRIFPIFNHIRVPGHNETIFIRHQHNPSNNQPLWIRKRLNKWMSTVRFSMLKAALRTPIQSNRPQS